MIKKAFDPSDWDHRVLCENPNCTGAIGPGGRCNVCGLEFTGDLPFLKDTAAEKAGAGGSVDAKIRTLLDKEIEILSEIERCATMAREAESDAGKREWYRATLASAADRSARIGEEIRDLTRAFAAAEKAPPVGGTQ